MTDRPRDFERTQPPSTTSSGVRETDDFFLDRKDSTGHGQQATDQAREKADQTMDAARSGLHQAEEQVDEKRGRAAGSMDQAAQKLHERADSVPGGERTTEMAHQAADRLQSASDYMREHDVSEMTGEVERFVRKHPTESLIAAAAAGFLVGRMLRG